MMHVIHVMKHYQDILNQIDIDSNDHVNESKEKQLKRARELFELHENPMRLEFDEPLIYRIIIRPDERIEFYETPVTKGKLLTVKHILDDTITQISEDKNNQWWPVMIRMWNIVRSYPQSKKNLHAISKSKI